MPGQNSNYRKKVTRLVYPELVVKNDECQVQTVQYHKLNSMLLNEVQKQQRQIQELTERLEEVLTAQRVAE